MKNLNIKKWIEELMASDPPRAKSLAMTIFGDAIGPHGGAIWLSNLIDLLSPFGVSDRLVRTSVFRLAEEGWLAATREGRRSLYALTAPGLRRVDRVYRRIYAPLSTHWDGRWTLIFSTAGMLDAMQRGALRKELLWEGFSMIAPGVFGHPSSRPDILEDVLDRVGATGKVFVCAASELDQVSSRPLRTLVDEGWELDSVIAGYRHFIEQFSTLSNALTQKQEIEPELSFVIRTLLIHAFRRVQLHDPQLPLELLPANWPGTAAYALCQHIYRHTYKAAEQHLLSVFEAEGDTVRSAAPDFYERFGGLS
ncbi:phenylacetic acid degradation operon negative regulatory protein PaaX [Paraherbaspirillum soli]|uniref:Phenylacetic acid degradation operon negative regulatory protein PaaX n=1 Tax=Paraherbaspirillum soli TaxID=631222 RepID=A0ABW0MD76_9BURK